MRNQQQLSGAGGRCLVAQALDLHFRKAIGKKLPRLES